MVKAKVIPSAGQLPGEIGSRLEGGISEVMEYQMNSRDAVSHTVSESPCRLAIS